MRKIYLLLFLFLYNSVQATELYQPGLPTRCLAMGSTCSSHVRGASALFFNPAALSRVEGFDFILAQAQAGISKDTVDFSSQFSGGAGFTLADINNLYGKNITADVTARSAIVMPNVGFGVFSNSYTAMQFNDPTFPTFNMKFINDYGYIIGGSFEVSKNSSIGVSAKHIKRWGGIEDVNVANLLGGNAQAIANANFQDHGVGHAIDLSYMTTLDSNPWKPTLTLVWQDVGVTTFNRTSGVKDPPSEYDNLIFGVSMKQELPAVTFEHAFEYKYIRTNGYDLTQKLHLGTEMQFAFLDLRAGINQGYVTYGGGVDLWFFQLDAAFYATEMGNYAGQLRNDRYNISLTINLDFDQSFKMKDTEGKRRRLKQRR